MTTGTTFAEFLRRIRGGDARAAEELVRQYEPVVRLEARLRLRDPRLGRVLDSMDICQSVLTSLFLGMAAGRYELEEPQQLVKLLVAMARNKVAFQARRHRFRRRDYRLEEPIAERAATLADRSPTPSRVAAGRELLDSFRRRLGGEERRLADLRAKGLAWAEIAAELGGTAQARRKQFERAVDRVAMQLGLDGQESA